MTRLEAKMNRANLDTLQSQLDNVKVMVNVAVNQLQLAVNLLKQASSAVEYEQRQSENRPAGEAGH